MLIGQKEEGGGRGEQGWAEELELQLSRELTQHHERSRQHAHLTADVKQQMMSLASDCSTRVCDRSELK